MTTYLSVDRWQTKTVMTLSALLSLDLHLPAFQRDVDEEHVNEIIAFQNEALNKYGSFLFVGDLILAKTDDNQTYVIDGNHRIHCIKKIYLKQPTALIGVTTILINGTGPTLLEVFSLINKSKPVPDYIIQGTLDQAKRKKLSEYQHLFTKRYQPFISRAKAPHRPNLNIDNFMENVAGSRMFEYFPSAEKMILYTAHVNQVKLRELDPRNATKAFDKVKKYTTAYEPLFLTNDPDFNFLNNVLWMAEFTCNYNTPVYQPTQYQPQPPPQRSELVKPPYKKRALSKTLRSIVWKSSFGSSMTGQCKCCNRLIEYDQFECGHIISERNGGSSGAANLLPVCSLCNKSMGSVNMDVFCRENDFTLT
jgi:hypothetical protein